MDNYFANLGFKISQSSDLIQLLKTIAQSSEMIECHSGFYIRWQAEEGAQLWFYFGDDDSLCGVGLGFAGQGIMPVTVIEYTHEAHNGNNQAGLHCMTNAQDGSPNYPFVFELIDRALMDEDRLALARYAQITAFADSITSFSSEQDYEQQEDVGVSFAVESFIPSGLFQSDSSDIDERKSMAIFSGRVLKCRSLVNPITLEKYEWALVKTLGGTVDVICSTHALNKPLRKGGVISGSFWLTGTLITGH